MSKIKLKIISTIIAFLLCFPLHFLYEKYPNFITSIFSPVNESIWEHMKILFSSILFTGILQKIYAKITDIKYNNVCISNFISAILSIPIFLIVFFPIYNIIGENMTITIIIMLITIVASEIISYNIMNKPEHKLEKDTVIFAIITYIIFTILTYYPPNNNIFVDPKTNTYGINRQNKNSN